MADLAALMDIRVDGIIQLKEKEFQLISSLVYEKFGINLTEKKKALVRGRLHSLLRAKGYTSFQQYYEDIISDDTGVGLLSLVDKISTNHSYFFREADHFDLLQNQILPEIEAKCRSQAQENLRIWCAGCAAGEEPYTIAMILDDYFGAEIKSWDIGMLATDISVSVLEQAISAVYPEQRVAGVPKKFRKYLMQTKDDQYTVVDYLKKRILFKSLNLMRETYPFKGQFDIVFCRNVMIYFDQPTRKNLLVKFHRHIKPGGYLFIGHSETLGRDTKLFRYVRPTVYRRI